MLNRVMALQQISGERRLPACWYRQPCRNELKDFAGKLPATTGWQPVLLRKGNPHASG
jgi:hypothetical protein